jgi:hypothetical protein
VWDGGATWRVPFLNDGTAPSPDCHSHRTHTFIADGDTDIVAAVAGMLSTLSTRRGTNSLKFDWDGPNRVTLAWRMTDRTRGFGVSFRKGGTASERAYYHTDRDAAEAIHEGRHTPAALTKDEVL